MPKTPPSPTDALSLSYEAALQELESLVATLESGQQPLEALLAGYQRGTDFLKACRAKLVAVEQQIKGIDAVQTPQAPARSENLA